MIPKSCVRFLALAVDSHAWVLPPYDRAAPMDHRGRVPCGPMVHRSGGAACGWPGRVGWGERGGCGEWELREMIRRLREQPGLAAGPGITGPVLQGRLVIIHRTGAFFGANVFVVIMET